MQSSDLLMQKRFHVFRKAATVDLLFKHDQLMSDLFESLAVARCRDA